MKRLALALASVLGVAIPAHAGIIYTFDYTAANGPVQSFSFSILSPAFIGPGTPAFTPFTITDGSTVFTIEQDLAGISTGVVFGSTPIPSGDGCFSFGSAGAQLFSNGCGWALPNSGTSMTAFAVDIPGGLPSQMGVYSNLIFDGNILLQPSQDEESYYNCCSQIATGTLDLTVSQTPEPHGFLLMAAGMFMFGTLLFARTRMAAHRSLS